MSNWYVITWPPPNVYLIAAYAFAVLVLGGYLGWTLRRLRELSGTDTPHQP